MTARGAKANSVRGCKTVETTNTKSNRTAGTGRIIHRGDRSDLGSVDWCSKRPPVPCAKGIAQEFEGLRRICLDVPERRFKSQQQDQARLGRKAYLRCMQLKGDERRPS